MPIELPKDPTQITSTETVFPDAKIDRVDEMDLKPMKLYEDGPIISMLAVAGRLDDLVLLQCHLIGFLRCALLDPFAAAQPSIHRMDIEGQPAFLCYYARSTEEFEDAAVKRAAIQQLSEERFKAKGQKVLDSMAADLASMAPVVEVVPGEALGALGGKR